MKTNIFTKNDRTIHTYVIAEAGLNHNGSAEIAKQLIDLAVEAKFQKKTVDNLLIKSTLNANNDSFPEFVKKAVLDIPVDELLSLGVFE